MEKIIDLEDRIPTFRERRRKRTNIKFIVLITFFSIVLIVLLYFQSPYSDVKKITVQGAELVESSVYEKKAGIKKGDSMWGFQVAQIEKSIQSFDWVKDVQVKKKWLTTVEIKVMEWPKVAYLSKDGKLYPMLENGLIFEQEDEATPINAPIFIGFDSERLRTKLLKELAQLNPEVLALISQINATPSKANPYAITLLMNDGYEVRGDLTSLASKLNYYPSIVAQIEKQEQFEKGVIDIEVGSYYRAYSEEYQLQQKDEDPSSQKEKVLDEQQTSVGAETEGNASQ